MSTSALDLYDRLRTAPNDEARARIIAESFEALEERYPHLSETATRSDLRETELRLIKEIAQVRTEIEQVRAETKETELRLIKEIEQVRADLKVVEIAHSHTSWLKWSFLFWLSQFTALMLLLWRLWPLAS